MGGSLGVAGSSGAGLVFLSQPALAQTRPGPSRIAWYQVALEGCARFRSPSSLSPLQIELAVVPACFLSR